MWASLTRSFERQTWRMDSPGTSGACGQGPWSPGEKAVRGAGSVTSPDLNLSGFEVSTLICKFGFFQGCVLTAGGY